MSKKHQKSNASWEERTEAEAKHVPVETIKAEELEATGGRAVANPIAELMDEGHPTGRKGGQLRGDQTGGHHGGSQVQTMNRGRD